MQDDLRSGLRRWWWLPAIGVVIGILAGWTLGQTSVVSSSEVLVSGGRTDSDGTSDSALTSNQYVNQRMPTYGRLATSSLVLDPATTRLGLERGALDGAVTATVEPEIAVVTLDVTGTAPEEARRRNEAVTVALEQAILRTENLPGQAPRVQLLTVSPSSLPDSPTVPRFLGASVGGVTGLLLGLLATLGLARSRRARPRRPSDVPGAEVLPPPVPRRDLALPTVPLLGPGSHVRPGSAPRTDAPVADPRADDAPSANGSSESATATPAASQPQ